MEKLFVDTNSFIFLLTKHDKWQKISKILDSDKYQLFTNTSVLNELKYKLLWITVSKKIKNNNKFEIIKTIKKDPKIRLDIFSKYLNFYINLKKKFKILPITEKEELDSCFFSNKYGLLPTDATIVANMRINKIKNILTDDSDFEKIDIVKVVNI